MVTELPQRITADEQVKILNGSIILINTTDCCTPTVQVVTPWGETLDTKIKMGQTITFKNQDNQDETYSIRSKGEGVQYAVPGSGYSEDTVTYVLLIVTYLTGNNVFQVTIVSSPQGASITVS